MADSRRNLTLAAAARGRKRAAFLSEYERREAWMRSADGVRMYRECRAKAQASANALGMDHGIELLWNGGHPGMVSWSFFLLPEKHNRYGHETTCEVVHPENLARTRRGHGYAATRPPSTVGPDYHGGPWVGTEKARELSRAWWRAWDAETHRPVWEDVAKAMRALQPVLRMLRALKVSRKRTF